MLCLRDLALERDPVLDPVRIAALESLRGELDRKSILASAGKLELDSDRFESCLDEGRAREVVERDLEIARQMGISSTPTLFVNGRPVGLRRGADPYDQISAVIEDELRRQVAGSL